MNSKRTLVAALSLSALSIATAMAQSDVLALSPTPIASVSDATLDQVIVTGEQAGPGLWKVSKGDHVLWIFGSYAPLPKKMTWRSKEVELIVAESQELITSVDVDMDIGFFGGLAMLPSMIGMRNNPNSATLKDVAPPDLYPRWLVQKEKYMGHDTGIEKWRPLFAALELYSKAIEKAGFEDPGMNPTENVQKAVAKIARKHDLKITTPSIEVKVPKARAWVKEFRKSPLDDLDCFTKTIERLESDMEQLRVRANAWAIGNVAALRAKARDEQQDACIAVLFDMFQLPGAQARGFQNIPTRIVDAWVAAAEAALAKNASSFAVLSIDDIFWKDGYVEKLRAKGYAVEEP